MSERRTSRVVRVCAFFRAPLFVACALCSVFFVVVVVVVVPCCAPFCSSFFVLLLFPVCLALSCALPAVCFFVLLRARAGGGGVAEKNGWS